jgi:hypothetical protein
MEKKLETPGAKLQMERFPLKGLSHAIDFKNVDKNFQN